MMFLAQINEDVVMDQIPLAEITQVKEMEAVEKGKDNMAKNENELMIETNPEGYNSGRTYYLKAESKVSCQEKIRKLKHYRAAAYERAHAQSAFRQAQLRVLKVYRSTPFQRFVAFLIISVSFFVCISDPEGADALFDRTLLYAYWMRNTDNKTPNNSMLSSP